MTGWPPQICAPDPQGAADAQLAAKAAVLANVLADFPALRPTNVPWAWWRATTLPGAGRRLWAIERHRPSGAGDASRRHPTTAQALRSRRHA